MAPPNEKHEVRDAHPEDATRRSLDDLKDKLETPEACLKYLLSFEASTKGTVISHMPDRSHSGFTQELLVETTYANAYNRVAPLIERARTRVEMARLVCQYFDLLSPLLKIYAPATSGPDFGRSTLEEISADFQKRRDVWQKIVDGG